MAAKKPIEKAVVVTTEHRGVFFGYTADSEAEPITLTRARNCLYWSADCKGFMGLATTGPTATCRVGAAVNKIRLADVTSVMEDLPEEAIKAWESAPWK